MDKFVEGDESTYFVCSGRYKSYDGMSVDYDYKNLDSPSRHFTYNFNIFVML